MHEQTCCIYCSRSMFSFTWFMLQAKIFLSRDKETNKFGHSAYSNLSNHQILYCSDVCFVSQYWLSRLFMWVCSGPTIKGVHYNTLTWKILKDLVICVSLLTLLQESYQ